MFSLSQHSLLFLPLELSWASLQAYCYPSRLPLAHQPPHMAVVGGGKTGVFAMSYARETDPKVLAVELMKVSISPIHPT